MQNPFRILIADRNRNVREFLRREFREAGYRAQIAKDAHEVLMMIDVKDPPDLLILDPEIPDVVELEVIERLQARFPPLPVVIHAFLSEQGNHLPFEHAAALVEKEGDTFRLKAAVLAVLRKCYPERLEGAEARE